MTICCFHQLAISSNQHFHQLALLSICCITIFNFINFPFPFANLSSTCCFNNFQFHQLANSSTCHFINSLFHQLIISSTHYFINSIFHQLIISSTHYFINSLFHQLIISSTHYFINSLFHQIAVSAFGNFIRLLYWIANEGKSAVSFCHQVAALVPDMSHNFYLVKNHKTAKYPATIEARLKISKYS